MAHTGPRRAVLGKRDVLPDEVPPLPFEGCMLRFRGLRFRVWVLGLGWLWVWVLGFGFWVSVSVSVFWFVDCRGVAR